jgi:hypothetical protein
MVTVPIVLPIACIVTTQILSMPSNADKFERYLEEQLVSVYPYNGTLGSMNETGVLNTLNRGTTFICVNETTFVQNAIWASEAFRTSDNYFVTLDYSGYPDTPYLFIYTLYYKPTSQLNVSIPKPIIISVSPITLVNNQKIIIIGHGFGSMPATTTLEDGSVDMPNFKISEGDGSGWGSNWNAGCTDQGDLIGVYLLSWNDTTVIINGFGSYLGQTNNGAYNCYWLQGDKITVTVNGATWTTIVQ